MFTSDGEAEYRKWEQWISDDEFQFSPDFVPNDDTPQGAIEYYKSMYRELFPMLEIDSPDFRWPTGIGLNC
ncbi:hypothetical protein HLV38_02965 [Berryella wangjianweii]|uniref:Uncharacterized protein n=1 Tax=Berryella wangjianweii TaxID=2734634 RepID=A0A6M8J684_9ACTN|nr:hypothetical protein [Berryella wangjianweii]QKF07198.1 hypothetical protein HLV38_02965 [Berryella wangjianweii]